MDSSKNDMEIIGSRSRRPNPVSSLVLWSPLHAAHLSEE